MFRITENSIPIQQVNLNLIHYKQQDKKKEREKEETNEGTNRF